MAELGLPIIDRAVHDTNDWINELADALSCGKQEAYHALRAGLHTLRDRLTVDEAADLSAQLPLLVRGIYYEGWRPAEMPQATREVDAYLETLKQRLLPDDPDPRAVATAVFNLLKTHCDPGQMSHVRVMLPDDVVETLFDPA